MAISSKAKSEQENHDDFAGQILCTLSQTFPEDLGYVGTAPALTERGPRRMRAGTGSAEGKTPEVPWRLVTLSSHHK